MYISLTKGTWILYFAGRASCRPRCYGCPDPLTRVGCCSRLPQSPCQRHTFSQSFSVSPLATQCASVCESARVSERKRESRSQPDIVDKRKYLENHMLKKKGVSQQSGISHSPNCRWDPANERRGSDSQPGVSATAAAAQH